MDLSLASMNLHAGADPDGVPYDVAAAVRALGAPVICLQEHWLGSGGAAGTAGARQHPDPDPDPDPVAAAAQDLGLGVYRAQMCAPARHPTLRRGPGAGPGSLGISVLTALPVVAQRVIELGVGPGDDVPRVAQVLMLALPGGGTLRLVNTHLTCSVASPVQLWRIWSQLRADPVPTVLAGDLNMPGVAARRCPGLTGLVSGRTFPSGRPLVQLDHILVSRGIRGEHGRVLPPAGSDHLPVRAALRLDGAAGQTTLRPASGRVPASSRSPVTGSSGTR